MKTDLTQDEVKMLKDFAKSHGITEKSITEERLLKFFFSFMTGSAEANEQLYSWFRLREDGNDNYLRTALDIVDEYGEDFLSRANIIEVGSGIMPALSERLLQLVPGIDKITVYDPVLKAKKNDLKLHPNRRAERIVLKKELFTPETPIEEDKPTLIISRHPCGGTPALIDVMGKHINIELYAVLCDCNDDDMERDFTIYHMNRGEKIPNTNDPSFSKIRIFGRSGRFEHNWQQYTAFKLRKIRPDAIAKVIKQNGPAGNVLLTKPRSK